MLAGLVNPKAIFKVLRAAGVRVRFDVDRKSLILRTDDGEKAFTFQEIEQMVNGADDGDSKKSYQSTDLAGNDPHGSNLSDCG